MSGFMPMRINPVSGNDASRRERVGIVAGLVIVLLFADSATAQRASIESARDLLASGRITEAASVLREVVAADPRNADARILLGTTLSLEGQRSESIAQLEEAVRLRPDSAKAYNTLGMVLSRFVEMKAAREAFEKALQLNPSLAEARVNLALLLAQAGEFGPAGEQLDSAILLQGDTPAAASSHYLRAKIWLAQKENGKAIPELQSAVKLRPDHAQAWSELGGVLHLQGDAKGAQQALEKAVALDPGDATAQYRLGVLRLENGEPHSAVDYFRKALHDDPQDHAILYNLVLALRRDGQKEEATRVDQKLSELVQTKNKVAATGLAVGDLVDAGRALEKSGDIRMALEKYRAALDLDPSDPVLRLDYGLALCRLGQWQQGATELREVLRLDPNNAAAAKALYIALDEKDRPLDKESKPVPAKSARRD